ncbi:membrane protein PM19L [Diospyros lotus]|uniref:membrane protein PM19L n=1 Tax=Diospyros lotus TaxID=55363 RepID=UPI002257A44A|nr:membrane protein PM19L [Diospyros lotus]
MASVGRNVASPLLFLNLVLYFVVLGFASWCVNRYINGQTSHPSFGGNGATGFFLTFSILAAVLGIVSKFAGGNHIRAWRNDSLAAACSSSLVAWAVTALAFGLACKEINVGGWRGWRLKVLEAFVIIVAFTELLYLLLLHAGVYSSRYGPGYRDPDYGLGAPAGDPALKGGGGGGAVPATRA